MELIRDPLNPIISWFIMILKLDYLKQNLQWRTDPSEVRTQVKRTKVLVSTEVSRRWRGFRVLSNLLQSPSPPVPLVENIHGGLPKVIHLPDKKKYPVLLPQLVPWPVWDPEAVNGRRKAGSCTGGEILFFRRKQETGYHASPTDTRTMKILLN